MMIYRTKQFVTIAERQVISSFQRASGCESVQGGACGAVVSFVRDIIAELQIADCKIDVQHAACSIFDIDGIRSPESRLLLLKPRTYVTRLAPQLVSSHCRGSFMDRVPSMSFNHLAKFQITGDGAEFDIGQPFPNGAALLQVLEEAF